MKITKIVMNNFRQYKGINEINFSTDNENNITVVYGEITSGKTTLLQSFHWVLYDKIVLQNPGQILNLEIEKELKPNEEAEVYVEVYIQKEDASDKLYKFKRYIQYRYAEGKGLVILSQYQKASCKENDTWIELNDFDEQVNQILPSKLSNYFFFDGERIKTIGDQQKRGEKEVGEAVKSILGLEDFNTAIKHLTGSRSVLMELNNSLNIGAVEKAEKLKTNIEQAAEEIDRKKQSRMKLEAEIDNCKNMKEELQKTISENRTTSEKQKEKASLQQRLEQMKKRRENMFRDCKQFFNRYCLDFFYMGLKGKIENIQKSGILNAKNEAIPNMNDKSIIYLLKRGYCVCGEKIEENSEHYKFLMEEMKKLPPKEIGNSISDFNKDISTFVNEEKSGYFKDELTRKYSELYALNNEIDEAEDRIVKISEQIQSNVNVGELEKKVVSLEATIEEYSRLVGQRNTEIEMLEKRKKADNEELLSLAGLDEKNNKIRREIEYTNRISALLSKEYEEKEAELIVELENEINKYLDKIYAGKRIMKIAPDYTFHLLYQYGDTVDSSESEGLGILKAISFMCGLFEVAKKKLVKKTDNDSLYPLVFDAPLSNVGSYERKNIMHYLPEVASQVIVFTREEKDLEDIDSQTKAKIASVYRIHKYTETYSEIQKEES